ncbi:CcoQ/FixQ family Cbb3-type cytochrome c oxidase assembly chaperone [Kaistella yonginensis]|uniref:CcoQ/FixQ family Cbb3-type cytochrome c oxidase assembly chaperone n=1 Tax=Kaistella yonginensis TaxID=658267 RepID=UPI0025B5F543|nr:CcoQ/FixQ family Cbb3-type cytochrome c oxidase assembly chaperone [Kaistella yonginensis]MDN3605956.1 CcoQ/FixQ family Cbb3-type cytochrome c oxidase assembly chaperone [Kaistella yonginensis]
MIPQSVKDIISNGENVGLMQTLALILFIIFFLGIIFYVFSRPKKHYDEAANAPLDDDIEDQNL